MARRLPVKHVARKVRRVSRRTDLFKPGDSKSVHSYFTAQIVTGIAIGLGAAIGSIVIKWAAEKWDRYTGLLPDSYRKEIYPAGNVDTK